jgi:hypothetical protein
MQSLPERPDIAPKKRSKGTIIASIIGGLIVLGALSNLVESDTTTTDTPTSVTSDSTYEITAQDVVDVMDPSQIETFCTAYYQLGDYDLALDQFTEGYGSGQDPSAEEVFDELLVRC